MIYLATHKEWVFPDNQLYRPIQVGAALHAPLGYLGDNTGDNISKENPNFCELTIYYWVWKNTTDDIVGVGHYRRIPSIDNTLFTPDTLKQALTEYDCLVNVGLYPKDVKDNYNDDYTDKDLPKTSTYLSYARCHNRVDMDLAWEAIRQLYWDYEKDFVNHLVFDDLFIPCNIMVTTREVFNDYCKWLFDILFFVKQYSPYKLYDDYNARVFGFLAERLQAVYLVHNKDIKVGGCTTINLGKEEE